MLGKLQRTKLMEKYASKIILKFYLKNCFPFQNAVLALWFYQLNKTAFTNTFTMKENLKLKKKKNKTGYR